MSHRFIEKLKNSNPNKLHFLKNEQEIEQLNLPKNIEDSLQMFHLFDVSSIVQFFKEKIINGVEIAILISGEDKVALISGKGLYNYYKVIILSTKRKDKYYDNN